MNMIEYAKSLFPDKTDKEIDYILWEKTCFPLDNPKACEQLRRLAFGRKDGDK